MQKNTYVKTVETVNSNSLDNKKEPNGITLISLIITIIVLLILAGVAIATLTGENGLLNKVQNARDETKKSQATETMNLKITNIQISSYTENQQLPNLQYLADKLCEDNDMEYVLTSSKEHASLDKIDVTNISSIFTKLKNYPYEFEIDSTLKLAKIDGIAIADKGSIPEGYIRPEGTIKITEAKEQIDVSKYQYADTSSLAAKTEETRKIEGLLDKNNINLSFGDLCTTDFLAKLSQSEELKKCFIDDIQFRNVIVTKSNARTLLASTGTELVPNLINNTNLFYSTQYDNSSYAAFRAFSTSSYWCTEEGAINNSFIGYKFNKKMNVKIVRFFNCSDNNYMCKDVKVQCSNDNITWTDATDVITLENVSKDNYFTEFKVDEPYQYWRVFILNGYQSSYCGCESMQFYGY